MENIRRNGFHSPARSLSLRGDTPPPSDISPRPTVTGALINQLSVTTPDRAQNAAEIAAMNRERRSSEDLKVDAGHMVFVKQHVSKMSWNPSPVGTGTCTSVYLQVAANMSS